MNNLKKKHISKKDSNISNLKKIIFPTISDNKLNQIMIDEESIKYITFKSCAQDITNIIMNNLVDFPCPMKSDKNTWNEKSLDKKMKELVITEMTAGVGGNVLNFSKYFRYVNAIELKLDRYQFLVKNIILYNFDNVNCYNDDSVKLLLDNDDIVQDIVFFDPPWGGSNYKQYINLQLKFGANVVYAIEDICKMLLNRSDTKMIVMKLPNNYDFEYLQKELGDYRIVKIALERMTIILVKNYA